MNHNNKSRAAAKPPMTTAERQAKWRSEGKTKRKVAEIPTELATALETKLKNDGKAYQAWLVEQIKRYLKGE